MLHLGPNYSAVLQRSERPRFNVLTDGTRCKVMSI